MLSGHRPARAALGRDALPDHQELVIGAALAECDRLDALDAAEPSFGLIEAPIDDDLIDAPIDDLLAGSQQRD